ncbi:hypothetical protein VYA_16310 [Vibrio alfacsensis]|nr:hypothetical protein VYA_16310 [Vibrio alfacsensis]
MAFYCVIVEYYAWNSNKLERPGIYYDYSYLLRLQLFTTIKANYEDWHDT